MECDKFVDRSSSGVSRMTQRSLSRVIVTPRFDSFHFGMFTCASCFGIAEGDNRVSQALERPVFGDQAEREILIPAGRHSFHPGCWESHLKDGRVLR